MHMSQLFQGLRNAETLLGQREFERALATASDVETALAGSDPEHDVAGPCADDIRARLESIRWAAEVGCRLTLLVGERPASATTVGSWRARR
jgi:hypothetical protein